MKVCVSWDILRTRIIEPQEREISLDPGLRMYITLMLHALMRVQATR